MGNLHVSGKEFLPITFVSDVCHTMIRQLDETEAEEN